MVSNILAARTLRAFTAVLSALSLTFLASCDRAPRTITNVYFNADSVQAVRQAKDRYWREGEASPLKAEDKALFQGLAYFPPTADFCVPARFEEFAEADTARLQTSDNELRPMVRAGRFHFRAGGDSCVLTAYRYVGVEGKMQTGYFVPFKDATNGTDTYRLGRYLDVAPPRAPNEPYILDFNYAFNPYCNYNEDYSCPLTPRENILTVAIEAGEKIFFRPRK